MKAEDYFNNSSFVSSELLDLDEYTIGLNKKVLFELMEEYATHISKKTIEYCKKYPGQTKHLTTDFIIKEAKNRT